MEIRVGVLVAKLLRRRSQVPVHAEMIIIDVERVYVGKQVQIVVGFSGFDEQNRSLRV